MLESNSSGTSARFVNNDYVRVQDLKEGQGLKIARKTSYRCSATINTSFEDFTETSTGVSSDYYIYVKSDGTTRRIQQKNIPASGFQNFETDVIQVMGDNLYARNVTGGSGHDIGLSVVDTTFFLNLDGYLTGAGGILPISQGGTSANTSVLARGNLGVSYSRDVMVYKDPLFRNVMVGESIRLVGGLSGTSVYTQGSAYNASLDYTITTPEGNEISLDIVTGGSGEITSASLAEPVDGFPFIYDDFIASVNGTPGSGASIQILSDTSYINFGTSNGENGVGFRYQGGNVQVRSSAGNDWEIVNYRFGVSELADTKPQTYSDGDILIYNGTSFIGTNITGDITIGPSGNATFTSGGLCLSQIYFGDITPSTGDFQNITGTTGNIQGQLDDKLYLSTSTPPVNKYLLVLNDGGVSTSTIQFDSDPPQDDHPQIPTVLPTNIGGVSFMNVYHSFGGTSTFLSSDIPNLSVGVLDDGSEIASRSELPDFIDLIHSSSGGLNRGGGNQLQLQIENLDDYELDPTTQHIPRYNDYVAIGPSLPPTNIPNQRVHLKDLLKVPFYSDPSSGVPSELSETPGSLAFFNSVGGVSYLGIATGDGSNWYGLSGFTTIS